MCVEIMTSGIIIIFLIALNVTLDSLQVQGIEGSSVSVCASISGNITLEVPVIAELTVFRAEQAGKCKQL